MSIFFDKVHKIMKITRSIKTEGKTDWKRTKSPQGRGEEAKTSEFFEAILDL